MSGAAAARLRRALASAALAVAATALALGAAELLARALFAAAPAPPPHRNPPDLPELHGISELMRPNVRGVYSGAVYRTDSHGARGPELPLEPPPRTLRIALIGDSVAMGAGVEEAETYAAQVARLLSQGASGREFEVVNLGIAGLNALAVARRLEELGALYNPHLIVYGYTVNDIEGLGYRATPAPERRAFMRRVDRFEDSPSALLRAVWPRLLLAWNAFWPLPGSYELELARNYRENPVAWRGVEVALDRIAAKSRELGACAVLFVHPQLVDLGALHSFTPYYRQVADAGRARGFHVVTGFDALRGERGGALRLSRWDTHPNAEGHRRLAAALRAGIEALPAECLAAPPGAARG